MQLLSEGFDLVKVHTAHGIVPCGIEFILVDVEPCCEDFQLLIRQFSGKEFSVDGTEALKSP